MSEAGNVRSDLAAGGKRAYGVSAPLSGGVTDKSGARKAVLVSAIALLLIALYRDSRPDAKEGPGGLFRRLWGVSVLSMFLALMADFAPSVAGPFAVLTVLGSLTAGGDQAINNLLGNLGKPATSSAPANPYQQGPVGTQGPKGATNPPSGKLATSPPPGVTGPQVG